ncbi:MAG: DUF2461 domain-containing protein [Flavobacteriales bacterium]|nr:DUF2461 domain-containing protein [Flavobacteriales bacterium]
MLKDTLHFLKEIQYNNNREWFNDNKQLYTSAKEEFDAFVEKLIPEVQQIDPSIGHVEVKDCTYRIYRDTRFSPNKTPYKTHMGAYINRRGKKSPYAGYYVHISPAEGSLWGGGLYCPDKDILRAIRWDIYDNIDEFLGLKKDMEKAGYSFSKDDMLKKNPLGFPKEWEQADLLRYKHYDMLRSIPDEVLYGNDLMSQTVKAFEGIVGLNRFFNFTIDENFSSDGTYAHSITHKP